MSDGNGFGWALEELAFGHRVRRRGWPLPELWIALHRPDRESVDPYPFIFTSAGDRDLWLPLQSDVLAADWEYAD